MLAGSELYSLDMSPTEALTQALRRSIGIRLGEVVEKLEGEVVELTIDTKLGISGGRSGKLTMRTTDMETIYDLGTKLIDALTREKVAAGDVIAIDKTNGKINKLGRSLGRAKDFDAVSAQIKWVSCPSGELLQKKKVEHVVTLHEIDVLNNNAGGGAVQALFSGATGEIRPEVRDMVDEKVVAWLEEGKASLLTGVLFIDEVHMLDLACFTFLHRAALASSLAPLLILASNKPDTLLPIRGAFGQKGAFGMPADFLDRLLIIPTVRYSTQELKTIISIRARQENVLLAPEALDKLTQLASEDCSLRYATLLISVAQLVAAKNKPKQQQNHNVLVQLNHIERAYNLFWDHKRSTKYCTDTFLA